MAEQLRVNVRDRLDRAAATEPRDAASRNLHGLWVNAAAFRALAGPAAAAETAAVLGGAWPVMVRPDERVPAGVAEAHPACGLLGAAASLAAAAPGAAHGLVVVATSHDQGDCAGVRLGASLRRQLCGVCVAPGATVAARVLGAVRTFRVVEASSPGWSRIGALGETEVRVQDSAPAVWGPPPATATAAAAAAPRTQALVDAALAPLRARWRGDGSGWGGGAVVAPAGCGKTFALARVAAAAAAAGVAVRWTTGAALAAAGHGSVDRALAAVAAAPGGGLLVVDDADPLYGGAHAEDDYDDSDDGGGAESDDDAEDEAAAVRALAAAEALVRAAERVSAATDADAAHRCAVVVAGAVPPPARWLRADRFAPPLVLQPPSERCRKVLLEAEARLPAEWAARLAAETAGFVARDLLGLCRRADTYAALDKRPAAWADLHRAAAAAAPSQLRGLDARRPSPGLTLDAVAGYEGLKRRLRAAVVRPWRAAAEGKGGGGGGGLRVAPPAGVVLHGPGGCGKTHAAFALAGELKANVIVARPTDLMGKYLGESEEAVRTLFARARGAAPCVLLFDDFDTIAANRASGGGTGAAVFSRVLSTMLNELDGVTAPGLDAEDARILVVAVARDLKKMDAALLRPGRLQEQLHVPLPDKADREALFDTCLAGMPTVADDVGAAALAGATSGVAGAFAGVLCREAATRAVGALAAPGVAAVGRGHFRAALEASGRLGYVAGWT